MQAGLAPQCGLSPVCRETDHVTADRSSEPDLSSFKHAARVCVCAPHPARMGSGREEGRGCHTLSGMPVLSRLGECTPSGSTRKKTVKRPFNLNV